jgi:transposase
MPGRHTLTDAEWRRLEPLLPTNDRRGHPFNPHRPMIDGILWVLGTGAPWRDLPERFGPWQSVYDRFNSWRKNGLWERVLAALTRDADSRGGVSREQWAVDGTSVRAHRAAAGARKKNPRGRAGGPRPGTEPGRLGHEDPPDV